MKVVTLLIPAYNEEIVLPMLFKRLEAFRKDESRVTIECLFIDDGSTDATLQTIKEYAKKKSWISYVALSRNFGKEIAMIAGLDHSKGDATVIIDADLQDPPELISEMITHWKLGYDDVYAKRRSRSGETWLKKITSRYYYKLLARSTSVSIQADTGDFRLLDKRCVEAIKQFRERDRYTKGIFSLVGFNKKEILYDRSPREAGVSKWGYMKLIDLAINGLTSFTTAPLRVSSFFGIIVSVLAFIYILYIVIRTIIFGTDLGGYPSMMAVMLFLGGVQLMSLGVIGEYIGRIYNETKQRPLYFIKDMNFNDKQNK
jgi:glycosyltransferase involved in cell wall biosynthesis